MIDLSQWAEFGILGLVIGALLMVMIIGFKLFMNHLVDSHENFKEVIIENKKQHSEDLKMLADQHREERAQWGVESDKRDLRYEASMKEFSRAIENLRDKI